MAMGVATLDFGAFPGSPEASVVITGQGSIAADSELEAWLRPEATSDHSADEHMLEEIRVIAGNIVAGTGFTIYGFSARQFPDPAGQTPMPYGQWSVGWVWV